MVWCHTHLLRMISRCRTYLYMSSTGTGRRRIRTHLRKSSRCTARCRALAWECPAGARAGTMYSPENTMYSPENVQQVHGQVADSEHNHHRHQHLRHFSPRVQQRLGVRLAIWMQTVATWKKSRPEVEATTISCCFNGNWLRQWRYQDHVGKRQTRKTCSQHNSKQTCLIKTTWKFFCPDFVSYARVGGTYDVTHLACVFPEWWRAVVGSVLTGRASLRTNWAVGIHPRSTSILKPWKRIKFIYAKHGICCCL